MFNLGEAETCVCKRKGNPSNCCDGELRFQEKGKKVTLTPRRQEHAKLLVLDSCYITNKNPKCDAVFFLQTASQGFVLLIEVKGEDIDRAFEQIRYTKENQSQYTALKTKFIDSTGKACKEHAFIISNFQVTKIRLQQLEREHNVRVKAILYSEATTKIPDVRDYV